jgi:hypothetical protein
MFPSNLLGLGVERHRAFHWQNAVAPLPESATRLARKDFFSFTGVKMDLQVSARWIDFRLRDENLKLVCEGSIRESFRPDYFSLPEFVRPTKPDC